MQRLAQTARTRRHASTHPAGGACDSARERMWTRLACRSQSLPACHCRSAHYLRYVESDARVDWRHRVDATSSHDCHCCCCSTASLRAAAAAVGVAAGASRAPVLVSAAYPLQRAHAEAFKRRRGEAASRSRVRDNREQQASERAKGEICVSTRCRSLPPQPITRSPSNFTGRQSGLGYTRGGGSMECATGWSVALAQRLTSRHIFSLSSLSLSQAALTPCSLSSAHHHERQQLEQRCWRRAG